MASVTCKLRSDVMQTTVEVQLYFPTDLPAEVGNDVKGVITLLHGFTNCGDSWMQMTAAQRYAADNGLVLIAPDCDNSFYQDMKYGGAYHTFVTQELPDQLSRIFRLPREREKNFIAGLSMGGYGALYLGLSHPDLYAGCASFSGAVDLGMMLWEGPREALLPVFGPVFGEELKLPESSDLYTLFEKVSKLPADRQPKIYLSNGLEDTPVYEIRRQNDRLHSVVKELPLAHYRRMEWTGVHEWNFWDRSLVYAIDYFLENGYAARKLADWRSEPTVFDGEGKSV